MEATVILGTFNAPRPVPRYNHISELYGPFHRPHDLVFALTCTVNSVTIGFLVTSLTKAVSPDYSVWPGASSRKSLGGSKCKNDGVHCVLGDLQGCRNVLVTFPRSVSWHILFRSSTDNSFDLMTWFLLWHALSTVVPYIDRCVHFQINWIYHRWSPIKL